MTHTQQTGLLLVCPRAESMLSRQRAAHDRSARDGIPAHVTLLYPFKPLEQLDCGDHDRLTHLFAASDSFVIRGSRTDWFGDRVLFVAPDDPTPVQKLIKQVSAAFPDYPPYQGAYAEVVPHLTIGHDHPIEELREAEREVQLRLPFAQPVDHVELWSGPAPTNGATPAGQRRLGGWQKVQSYALGGPT